MWRHRELSFPFRGRRVSRFKIGKAEFHLDNKLPGLVLDTIDALWPEGRPRPLLTHKKRTAAGWHLIFTLQPGISFNDVYNKLNYFRDACRRVVNIDVKGGYLHLDIIDQSLKTYYSYEWDPEPYLEKMDLPVPIGYTAAGLEVADLASLPHLRCGGTTYTGKSNFLHNLFISLSMLPNTILAVIDLALLEFSYVRDHAAFASDTVTALQMLQALEREMHRRRKVLNAVGVVKIQDYKAEDLPFIILVIDEFSFVNPGGTHDKEEKEIRKECHAICSNIAALARKVGIHLVVAMQRPDKDILPGQLKANLPGAISFKTINRVNSEIILDNGAAADLPDIQGRAIWQVGNKQAEVQVMHLPVKKARKILRRQSRPEGGFWFEQSQKRLPPR